MKFTTTLFSTAFLVSLCVSALPVRRDVDPSLVPSLGFTAGRNPTGTGDCDGAINGADGKPIKVPCSCPPDQQTFIAALDKNVAAGHAVNNPSVPVSFPTSSSNADQQSRIEAAIVTLQNLNGPGKGCPVVSTTLGAQQKALQNGGLAAPTAAPVSEPALAAAPATIPAASPDAVTSASAPSAAATAPSSAPHVTGDVDPSLVPDLGFTAGKNPTGTGDCDGAVNGSDGKPIKVPCSCPPDQQTFLAALNKNIAAGHAVNNPTVPVSFPTSSSSADQQSRIEAAIVTLQNLNGPGKGCPVVSTTLGAQQKALQSGSSAAAPATSPAPSVAVKPATAKPAPSNPAPAPATSSAAAAAGGVDPSLVPSLGFTAGKNPTGTGDCDGAVNGADGKPIKVPCSCPPDQQTFIAALDKNVAAGHAVNNPSVSVSFPTGSGNADQQSRIEAAIVTLQNLNGPGKGCPVVSTTLGAQQKALQG